MEKIGYLNLLSIIIGLLILLIGLVIAYLFQKYLFSKYKDKVQNTIEKNPAK